jgi:hypothetical protein
MNRRSTRSRKVDGVEVKVDGEDLGNDVADKQVYPFNGVDYPTYQAMVDAKRRRNEQVLKDSGLLAAVADAKEAALNKARSRPSSTKGIQSRAARTAASESREQQQAQNPAKRRKSNRLQGIESDGLYVDDERAGRFSVATTSGGVGGGLTLGGGGGSLVETKEAAGPEFYRNRINDGSPLTVKDAIEAIGGKWMQENSVDKARSFVSDSLYSSSSKDVLPNKNNSIPTAVLGNIGSPTKLKDLSRAVHGLSVQDTDVAKVCPERIYSVSVHPAKDTLIVAAGDKVGNIGLWNVNDPNDDDDGVYLFRPHRGAVCCLEWIGRNTSQLLSTSYDGTVRLFNAESQQFTEIFATYSEEEKFKGKLGYGLDTGSHFWTQYGVADSRNPENCMFLSTSVGTAMHLDLRSKESITFHEDLSEKKINTLR